MGTAVCQWQYIGTGHDRNYAAGFQLLDLRAAGQPKFAVSIVPGECSASLLLSTYSCITAAAASLLTIDKIRGGLELNSVVSFIEVKRTKIHYNSG